MRLFTSCIERKPVRRLRDRTIDSTYITINSGEFKISQQDAKLVNKDHRIVVGQIEQKDCKCDERMTAIKYVKEFRVKLEW